jgi:hypothetical protein
MKIHDLKKQCEDEAVRNGAQFIVLVADHFPRAGFPRGELLCVNSDRKQVRRFKIQAVLTALDKIIASQNT